MPVAAADSMLDTLASAAGNLDNEYQTFKDHLSSSANIQFSFTASSYLQSGTPRGGAPVTHLVYTPSISWAPFSDTAVGSGVFNFSYQYHHFLGHATSASQQASMGLLTTPSDWFASGYEHDQLTYSHTLPGTMNWLTLTVGQYGFGLFDDNQYAAGAQSSFIGYALAQNATQTYATAGLGAYAQATTPDRQFQLSGGFQSAMDVGGKLVTTSHLAASPYAHFVAVRWVPKFIEGSSYGVLWYEQPSVPLQPGRSQGISISAAQSVGDNLGLFLRISNVSGASTPIQTSVAAGGVVTDPFDRNDLDQLGVGLFWNKTNRTAVAVPARVGEWGAEVYYNFTLTRRLQLTPDIQMFFNPALNTNAGPAAVFTIRTTAAF